MAVLSDADRREIWARWMRTNTDVCGITKAELSAAFDALDQWVDDNAATINQAIPLPARTSLNAAQKALLLSLIVEQRYVKGA